MKSTSSRPAALLMALMLALSPAVAPQPAVAAAEGAASRSASTFSQQELDRLLAPIALYPDPLLAQILMASTYPLEVVEAARWVKANPKVTGSALETAMSTQSWDPAVKALTAVPQVLQQMNDNLDWMQKLGDAFLAQQQEVMSTVQSLRARADSAGNLKTTEQQVVTTRVQGSEKIYVIESPKPEVVYVPTYNPTVVYGNWWYPVPPYAVYPPAYVYPPGLAFATGIFVGAALWGACNWGWGRSDVNVNVNRYNSFNRTNISSSNWTHNVDHRRGVAYRDQNVARQYNRGGDLQAAQARENFRGRAESGRSELKGMDRAQIDDRVREADRRGRADAATERGGLADRRGQAGERGQGAPGGDRFEGAGRGEGGGRFEGRGEQRGAGIADRSSGGGFAGVGHGAATREASQRGSFSRAEMGGRGGGPQAGFAGGGGRAGGAAAGGGFRGGGGRGR